MEVRSDECKVDIENLREKTDYVLRIIVVIDEYFDRFFEKYKFKKLRVIFRDRMVVVDDLIWLLNIYIMVKTVGTEFSVNLKIF